MIIAVFAAASVVASSSPPPAVEPPATHVEWFKRPDGNDIAEYYPDAAAQAEISGRVTIGCRISAKGALEACKVEFEDPPGLYFGEAALKMSKRFAMTPPDAARAPPVIHIPIHFGMERGPATYGILANTIMKPLWVAAPTYDQVLSAYARRSGNAASVFDCNVTADGSLDQCQLLPTHSADAAARSLLPYFKVRVDPSWRIPGQPLRVNVPVRPLDPAALAGARPIPEPAWIAIPDAEIIAGAFPAKAAAAGVASGRGVAQCVVGPDGGLQACAVAAEAPEGLGFGEAAVRIAGGMRMNLWTPSGSPVIGAAIRLPIRFEQPPPPAH